MNRKRKLHTRNAGFSLVELIIVIAIMAILAGALAPALIKYIEKSRRTSDLQAADAMQAAMQRVLTETNFSVNSGDNVMIVKNTMNFNDPATCIEDELYCELGGMIPDIKSYPDYYWYIKYNDSSGAVPEIHLTDGPSGQPIYELYPNNTAFANADDKKNN
ncbi:MAG: prepilin-type N-terminal cleavage/methylation domain-containing protein [Lachnospiraceae bacterium]|nr:prepilin-type N-terminal cleavage/methylation domain-containing protein [Lachnospiraceae bacterium]